MSRSKTIPISIIRGMPKMVTSAARKIPFSSTSSAITCISALLRVTMRNAALKISATAAARVTSVARNSRR